MTPSSIEVGSEANVSFSLYNIGKTKLYNTSIKFQADSVTGGDTYLGNLDPGATGSVDAYLTGVAATTDDGKVKMLITFEDESGEATTVEKELELYVTEAINYDDMNMDGGYDDGTSSSGGFHIWYVLLPLIIVLAAAVVWFVLRKKKAKKAALLDARELDELEELDPDEDEDADLDSDDEKKE